MRTVVLLLSLLTALASSSRETRAAAPCGKGTITSPGARTVRRQPFLQQVGTRDAIVVWAEFPRGLAEVVVTRPDGREVARSRGTHVGSPRLRAEREEEVAEELLERDEPETPEAEDWFPVATAIHGLEPGKTYCYRLVADGVMLTDTALLRTEPAERRELRFLAFGDSGTGSAPQRALAGRFVSLPVDLVLVLGDLAYRSGTHQQLQDRFFDVYADLLSRAPVYPVLGNHDVRSDGGEPYLESFVLPGNEHWYSFDRGDVHFVALDTTRLGDAQLEWLDRDLRATNRPWIIVYGHHPPFTSSRRGPSKEFHRQVVPLLGRYGVDLVLTGHDHHYERTTVDGVTYLVSGGGGADLRSIEASDHAERAVVAHHYLDVRVTRRAIEVRAVDLDGAVIDAFEIPPVRR